MTRLLSFPWNILAAAFLMVVVLVVALYLWAWWNERKWGIWNPPPSSLWRDWGKGDK